MTTTVSIVESRSEFMERFSKIISKNPEFTICDVAASMQDAVLLMHSKRADIYLVDMELCGKGTNKLVNAAKRQHPDSKFIISMQAPTDSSVIECIYSGATGFLTKTCSQFELLNCLRLLRDSSAWVNPEIAGKIFQHLHEISINRQENLISSTQSESISTQCTPKEVEILRAFEKGETVKRIANSNRISPNTVTHHSKNIFRKLEAHSRSEAIYKAKKIGII